MTCPLLIEKEQELIALKNEVEAFKKFTDELERKDIIRWDGEYWILVNDPRPLFTSVDRPLGETRQ